MKMQVPFPVLFAIVLFAAACGKETSDPTPCLNVGKTDFTISTTEAETEKALPNRGFSVIRETLFGSTEEFLSGKTDGSGKAHVSVKKDSGYYSYKLYFKSDQSLMTTDFTEIGFCKANETVGAKFNKPVQLTVHLVNKHPTGLDNVRMFVNSKTKGLALGFVAMYSSFSPDPEYATVKVAKLNLGETRDFAIAVCPNTEVYISVSLDGTNEKVEKNTLVEKLDIGTTIEF